MPPSASDYLHAVAAAQRGLDWVIKGCFKNIMLQPIITCYETLRKPPSKLLGFYSHVLHVIRLY